MFQQNNGNKVLAFLVQVGRKAHVIAVGATPYVAAVKVVVDVYKVVWGPS